MKKAQKAQTGGDTRPVGGGGVPLLCANEGGKKKTPRRNEEARGTIGRRKEIPNSRKSTSPRVKITRGPKKGRGKKKNKIKQITINKPFAACRQQKT